MRKTLEFTGTGEINDFKIKDTRVIDPILSSFDFQSKESLNPKLRLDNLQVTLEYILSTKLLEYSN